MMTERDRKKAAKAEKKAAKEAAEREKEAKIQKGLIEVFNDKQAKAGKESDAVAKLKQWLLNPPYKSTNRDMKKETFYSVMQCLQQVNNQQWETLFNAGNIGLDEAIVLNKYISTAYEMLTSKDSKTGSFVSFPLLNKAQIKMVSAFGNAIIFKSGFEKGQLL